MKEELKKVIDRLQEHINLVPLEFLKYPEGELRRKPAPDKWSKKEILGHLIDSAANNHHRFIKIQFMPSPFLVESYAQMIGRESKTIIKKIHNNLSNFGELITNTSYT